MDAWTKHIPNYLKAWWIPITTNLLAIGIFFLGTLVRRDWVIDLALIVFYVNILGTLASSIVQVIIRRWYFIFPQIGIAAFLFYYLGMIMALSPPDYYGAHKTIPDDVDFSMPLNEAPSEEDFERYDFVLINNFQPGLYLYQTDHLPTKTGHFYVKAFEINSNDRLSGDRMTSRSKVVVDKLDQQIWQGEFTIYEGSWGDEYGSRIELWYQPVKGQEYKVEGRNFIIEGWQR